MRSRCWQNSGRTARSAWNQPGGKCSLRIRISAHRRSTTRGDTAVSRVRKEFAASLSVSLVIVLSFGTVAPIAAAIAAAPDISAAAVRSEIRGYSCSGRRGGLCSCASRRRRRRRGGHVAHPILALLWFCGRKRRPSGGGSGGAPPAGLRSAAAVSRSAAEPKSRSLLPSSLLASALREISLVISFNVPSSAAAALTLFLFGLGGADREGGRRKEGS